jgi:putative PIG3 family NAD(P)H quinone oxidoreductase
MRALVIGPERGVSSLEVREVATPEVHGDRVRVRVQACGLNRADLLQASGHYPPPPGEPVDIPGLEFAGVVDQVGPHTTGRHKVGDRVFGIVGGGGMAEFVVCHERMAVPIPERLDFVAAAAVPEAFITAWDALERCAGLMPGQSVLIHAVGSGVGTAAVQLAHAMGCRVFGTSRTAAKLERARGLGLDVAIDATREDFAAVVLDQTRGAGVAAVVDFVGGPALEANLRAIATGGTIVQVGLLGGATGSIDLRLLMNKRARLVGTTLRSRPLEEKILATRAFTASVIPWLASGQGGAVIDQVFPLEEIQAAAARMSANLGFGKVILTLDVVG